MPKVKFVVEHHVVEAQAGRKLREIAQEARITVDREFFRGLNCHGLGLCGCCKVWVHPSSREALNSPNLRERIFGMSAGRRLACQARVQGDVEVTTMPGGDDRLDRKREISPTPDPVHDASAIRKPVDEGASIMYPLGHPSAVGNGEVPAPSPKEPARQEAKPAAAKDAPAKEDLTSTRPEAPKAKTATEEEKPADPKPEAAKAKPEEPVVEAPKEKPAEPVVEAPKEKPADVAKEPSSAEDDKKAKPDANAK